MAFDLEVKDNLLKSMLNLYLRVRRFSYTKDVISKHKFALKKKKRKTLRKKNQKGHGRTCNRVNAVYITTIIFI